jgi:hypothetical protein
MKERNYSRLTAADMRLQISDSVAVAGQKNDNSDIFGGRPALKIPGSHFPGFVASAK